MLDNLKSLLFGTNEEAAEGAHTESVLHRAAAGLLVEAAMLDGHFHDEERRRIETLLAGRFDLPANEVADLIEAAEAASEDRVELHTITHTVRNMFEPEERIHMMEMLWEIAYADGELDDFESNMMRRVTGLLYVSDRDSGAARKRALAKLGH